MAIEMVNSIFIAKINVVSKYINYTINIYTINIIFKICVKSEYNDF